MLLIEQEKLEALTELDSGLNERELDFIESLWQFKLGTNLTPAQKAWLNALYTEHVLGEKPEDPL